MKKVFFGLVMICACSFAASAQTTEVKTSDKKGKVESPQSKTKVKKTTTPGEKVHNLIHPKQKKYSGVKLKEAKKEE